MQFLLLIYDKEERWTGLNESQQASEGQAARRILPRGSERCR
jgi:hypothetical protein